ncbi:MAG: site-specific integrase [Planctomycetes bacterium]|nr:site-specific integrase [Planctomycetota bacterium]NOG53087.1 site-specific integrase [Planctomycetota bacterium]
MIEESQARVLYHRWLSELLDQSGVGREQHAGRKRRDTITQPRQSATTTTSNVRAGSLVEIATGLLEYERTRVRDPEGPRARGTIDPDVYSDKKKHVHDFLEFVNELHGQGSVASMALADLSMGDVESFNRRIVELGYSQSQVGRRMQVIRQLVNRAGRPEHGQQVLQWNWNSLDILHGLPTRPLLLPDLKQLKALIEVADLRGQTMIWIAIGLGFGQRDLATLRVGQIDRSTYDMRRGKTGIERYGRTPPLVWKYIAQYLGVTPRRSAELMFTTRNGLPIVHGKADSVQQWWNKMRVKIGESNSTLGGFYSLRHLGATEFGSRPRCSIGDMKRWLGHSARSDMADRYMKPVSPELKAVVEWVRRRLKSSQLD